MVETYDTQMYWLIVMDTRQKQMKNAQILDRRGRTFEELKERFEKKFPFLIVLQGGEGIENRPLEVKDLPYIEI